MIWCFFPDVSMGSKSFAAQPRFTWSRNPSTAALSGRASEIVVKDAGRLKNNAANKNVYCKMLFAVIWIEQKIAAVTGCLIMDLF